MCDKNCKTCSTENVCKQTYLDCWPKPFGQSYSIPPSRQELADEVKPKQSGTDWLGWVLAALPFI